MSSPKINIKEVDISTRVPSTLGTYASVVIPAPKGEINKPIFITSDTELLNYFTPNQRVEVGYNMAFYSALAYLSKANKLWVVRADNSSTYGGLLIKKVGTTLVDTLVGNITDVDHLTKTFTLATDKTASFSVGGEFSVQGSTDNDGTYTVVSATLVSGNTEIVVVETVTSDTVDGSIHVDVSVANANSSLNVSLADPEAYSFNPEDLLLITGANQGSWANDIGIKLFTYASSPDVVKEPNAFQIQVYKISTGELLETHTCSRDINAKDGYSKNIYVEDVLKSSSYIRAVDNTANIATSTMIEQSSVLTLSGATNGSTVTDTNMINALNTLNNRSEIPLTVIMDGGWTTPAYQIAIDSLCQSRKDCVGILSTPYASEDATSYMTDLVTYRKTTLNLNSSYSALYTPHVKIRDRFNDRDIFVSPDGYAAAAISDTSSNYEIWFAPAGFKRGTINVLDTKRRFTEGEMDLLYDSGINPVKFSVGKGIAIWGQKTLSSRPSALDRLNVRLLLVTIEPAIANMLEDYLFEFNDDFTRLLIKTNMDSYMDNIKSRKGVYDYRVICDESNNTSNDIDNNLMNVWLFVQPTKTAEFVQLSVVVTRTGFDLNLAQNLLG